MEFRMTCQIRLIELEVLYVMQEKNQPIKNHSYSELQRRQLSLYHALQKHKELSFEAISNIWKLFEPGMGISLVAHLLDQTRRTFHPHKAPSQPLTLPKVEITLAEVAARLIRDDKTDFQSKSWISGAKPISFPVQRSQFAELVRALFQHLLDAHALLAYECKKRADHENYLVVLGPQFQLAMETLHDLCDYLYRHNPEAKPPKLDLSPRDRVPADHPLLSKLDNTLPLKESAKEQIREGLRLAREVASTASSFAQIGASPSQPNLPEPASDVSSKLPSPGKGKP
jgi:hypothetical protein